MQSNYKQLHVTTGTRGQKTSTYSGPGLEVIQTVKRKTQYTHNWEKCHNLAL